MKVFAPGFFAPVFSLALCMSPGLAANASASLAGRWDLTIVTPQATYPSWVEIADEGGSPVVRVVGRVASVHPAQNVKLVRGRLSFSTEEWFEKTIPVTWELTAAKGKMTGTQKRSDGVQGKISGMPAPLLDRAMPSAWKTPEPLFNGRDLTGWEPLVTEQGKPPANHWVAQNREMVNQAAGANIRTIRTFQDFKLHVEYNCPDDGNSGVYLRGRYEVQVEYEPADKNDKLHGMGAIYGFLAPSQSLPPQPGKWETYDITFVGRTVTVARNGVTTINRQQIPGITGGALDSNEAAPGPIYIQGDHTGGMKYRNITIAIPQ